MSYQFAYHIYQGTEYLMTRYRWQNLILSCPGDRERIWGQISTRKFGKEQLDYWSLDRLKIRKHSY